MSNKINIKNFCPAFIFIILLFNSCTKQNTTPKPTYFSIYCVDELSNPLSGVTVNVFNDSTDWATGANIVYSGKTNDSGRVSFGNVPSQVYYFQCIDTSNCYLNFTGYFNSVPIPANQITNVGLTLSGFGELVITNRSAGKNPYMVKVNGKIWKTSLAYGQTISKRFPIGDCTIEAIQLGGYINAPADLFLAASVNQCQTTVQIIN